MSKKDVDGLFVLDVLYPMDLPELCILDCSASGRVDNAVEFWSERLGLTVNQKKCKTLLKKLRRVGLRTTRYID